MSIFRTEWDRPYLVTPSVPFSSYLPPPPQGRCTWWPSSWQSLHILDEGCQRGTSGCRPNAAACLHGEEGWVRCHCRTEYPAINNMGWMDVLQVTLTKMFDLLLIFLHKGFMLLFLLLLGLFGRIGFEVDNALPRKTDAVNTITSLL